MGDGRVALLSVTCKLHSKGTLKSLEETLYFFPVLSFILKADNFTLRASILAVTLIIGTLTHGSFFTSRWCVQYYGWIWHHKPKRHAAGNEFVSLLMYDAAVSHYSHTSLESGAYLNAKFLGSEVWARGRSGLSAPSHVWSFTMYVHFSSNSASVHLDMSASSTIIFGSTWSAVFGAPSVVNMTELCWEAAWEKDGSRDR